MLAVAAQSDTRGIDRLDRRHRVALDTGYLYQSADRITGQAQVVFHANFSRVFDLLGVPPSTSVKAPAAIEQALPTSP